MKSINSIKCSLKTLPELSGTVLGSKAQAEADLLAGLEEELRRRMVKMLDPVQYSTVQYRLYSSTVQWI